MTDGGGNVPSTDHKSLIEKAAERLPGGRDGRAPLPQQPESREVEKHQQWGMDKASATKSVTINHSILRKNGIISSDNLRTRTTEEFRLIKRGLLNRYTRNGADRQNLVLVTSSLSGEGKSF